MGCGACAQARKDLAEQIRAGRVVAAVKTAAKGAAHMARTVAPAVVPRRRPPTR